MDAPKSPCTPEFQAAASAVATSPMEEAKHAFPTVQGSWRGVQFRFCEDYRMRPRLKGSGAGCRVGVSDLGA